MTVLGQVKKDHEKKIAKALNHHRSLAALLREEFYEARRGNWGGILVSGFTVQDNYDQAGYKVQYILRRVEDPAYAVEILEQIKTYLAECGIASHYHPVNYKILVVPIP